MSFFTEPKNAGIALMIVAVLNIIAGIIGIYDGATNGFNGYIKGLTGNGNTELFHIIFSICICLTYL